MKRAFLLIGNIVFWLAWPALWIYLRISKRTRLFLVCNGEFLVLKGWLGSGKWMLPGGGLHKNEDTETGLLRELYEETGIKLENGIAKFAYAATQSQYGLKFKYSCYMVELTHKPNVKTQRGEIVAYAWQSVETPVLPMTSDTVKALTWWQHNE